ncbi:uncharacterized protein DNG_09978 [Cephalotrichum gorgonifer]|uniref:Uncharacterized protein n=1 Tax=Cephalotrichum gorgonifer TaxID=2041049 RepID=A0AAE8N7R9_9PEZI|nr:uncharacterized protein DNG_09978 [Cephalotrichum gorgonifer]
MTARLQQLTPGPHRYLLAGLWAEMLMDTIACNVTARARIASPGIPRAVVDVGVPRREHQHSQPQETGRKTMYMAIASMDSVQISHFGKEDTGVFESAVTLTGQRPRAQMLE